MEQRINHLNTGIEAYKAGNIDKAIQELEEATRQENENVKAFNYLGAAYFTKGRTDAAIGAFKMAEQISPGTPSIHFNIAQAYEASGILGEAEYEYERTLELDPNYTKAREALERLKKKLNHL